jgi:hypothetical protein
VKPFENKLLEIIKTKKGISYNEIENELATNEKTFLKDRLQTLISNNYVTFIWDKYYTISRSIGIFKKDSEDMLDEIEINYISVDELKSIMTSREDDPDFYEGYVIQEKDKAYFERTNNIILDFSKFDYVLLCGFDN